MSFDSKVKGPSIKDTNNASARCSSQISDTNPAAIMQRVSINPRSMTSADAMVLQRAIGNQALGRFISATGVINHNSQLVQREALPEEEEIIQGKFAAAMQREEIPEEDEKPVQMMKPAARLRQALIHKSNSLDQAQNNRVIQKVTNITYQDQNIEYHLSAVNPNRVMKVGRRSEAFLDPLAPTQGTTPDTNLTEIYSRYKYKKGHLLNAHLGGVGKDYNLYPFTNSMNTQHSQYENVVKELVVILHGKLTAGALGWPNRRVRYLVEMQNLPAPGVTGHPRMDAAGVANSRIHLEFGITQAGNNITDQGMPHGVADVTHQGDSITDTLEGLNANFIPEDSQAQIGQFTLHANPGGGFTHDVRNAGGNNIGRANIT